ncbi:anti-sigma factor domain-containing protein [Ectobacillus polymachus]|uniref:anti-sigma factor domain-containing protein n=1 Tax=Ectobacillus polymachus TaxID=1508806 RepID=UPI003A842412
MKSQAHVNCNHLMSYIIGECSEKERIMFERHLLTCSSCQKEAKELQDIWDVIPFHLEEVHVPSDLKTKVMNSIFKTEDMEPSQVHIKHADRKISEKKEAIMKWRKPSLLFYIGTVAVLLFTLLGSLVNNMVIQKKLQATEEQSSLPTQILKVFSLTSADATEDSAKGTVWLLKQGKDTKIIANLEGLSATKGNEAYQVWLINKGQRRNAGTFYVEQNGKGALSYIMVHPEIPFDSIGITLEPDADGTYPRGRKILGT